jgi:hypothetical protein
MSEQQAGQKKGLWKEAFFFEVVKSKPLPSHRHGAFPFAKDQS